LVLSAPTFAGSTVRSTCKDSVLCDGLLGIFEFQQGADYTRENSYGLLDLFEPDGADVASAAGKVGTGAVSFAGTSTSYLYTPVDLGVMGNSWWAVAFWVYPTSAGASGQSQVLLSEKEVDVFGSFIDLHNAAGAGIAPRATVYDANTNAATAVTWGSNISLNVWHEVVVTFRPKTVYGNGELNIQVDNGTRVVASITNAIASSSRALYVGKANLAATPNPYTGRLDHLTIAANNWTTAMATLFWNGGSGLAYPFDTN
jgi:hypothetical protein